LPTDAVPFTSDQLGEYGYYIDIPINDTASNLGFIIVNREDGSQTEDLRVENVAVHQQVFLHEDKPNEVFTNPFYVSNEKVEEPFEEHVGEENITVSATVSQPFHYDQHALLDVIIQNDSELGISRIEADVSELGGSSRLSISPELNRVTLSATHDVLPGEYTIPISIWDETNGRYDTEAVATIISKETEERDWDEEIIYFMLTDRFADGDPTNNDPYGLNYENVDNPRGAYQGGDFAGVTENLDYLDELGITTIWISPIVENVVYDVSHASDDGSYFGYHGYWAVDFEELNPHLGTLEEFHQLIDAAAERDISIMVDVVLNHTGYGLHPNDELDNPPVGYPTNEDRARFDGMLRESSGSDDLTMELAGLPDFVTEDHDVRTQIVDWQKGWIERSTTPNGNAIASYRVDTVKHVDDTTWQHFKNELVAVDPNFRLIGESWGAGYHDDQGYLNTGTMDSLLDFRYKSTAGNFVNGHLEAANNELIERNHMLTSAATLGQFLGSHDEDGFLYSHNGEEGKLKLAAALQITSKGQPVIYYGEELGQTGPDNWPVYENRYDFGWDIMEGNDILDHYQRVIQFRNEFSEVLSRGTRSTFAGSDEEGWLIAERSYNGETVYLAFNVTDEEQEITLEASSEELILIDHYSGEQVEPIDNTVTFTLPTMDEGGTALLSVQNGELLPEQVAPSDPIDDEIPNGYFRLHVESLPSEEVNQLGLWLWEDVTNPSTNWPTGAVSVSEFHESEYGYFYDIDVTENAEQIGFLFNHTSGENLTGDLFVDILSSEMNEAWVDAEWNIFAYEPLQEENHIRVNYTREDQDYEHWGLWTWGDVTQPTEGWPTGALDFNAEGQYGPFVDVELIAEASILQFLFVNQETSQQTNEYQFNQLSLHTQIFVRENDNMIYTNPYFVSESSIRYAEQKSESFIDIQYSSIEGISEESIAQTLQVFDTHGNEVDVTSVNVREEENKLTIQGEFSVDHLPYRIVYDENEVGVRLHWKFTDEHFAYDGELGVNLREDGTAELKLWAPTADDVRVILYDKEDQYQVIHDHLSMTLKDRGVWSIELTEELTNIADHTGYYYHFEIERNGESVLALDPYARSMATWDNSNPNNYIGKAAIVNPSDVGPDLDFASIEGFEKREDAIIYELHVRDFTSDPSIEDELEHPFGTFSAFKERLDYIEELGVTHIQLLPVMSYLWANEYKADERMMEYASTNTDYNWGYDPQSYFSLTGMYTDDPDNPERRIEEFKQLVDEIHKRGMGVILDVVYNHTASMHVFEDLEPHYYHFMDKDGTPRESFGGGRLGTTHEMSRRILVDSIKYWTEEYKVDGFRFDMMGDHDAETIQIAYDTAKEINPNVVMIGEGWVTYVGDEKEPNVQPADQTWMAQTESVGSFSDDFRNELKSGFGSEGEPRFITGGARDIQRIYDNLTANPHNFIASNPGDVVPYIAAHDNLTLHDVIAQSIQKDPKDHQEEIHQRIRLGNLMVLTAQGTPFLHGGQEFGRTKQFRHPDFIEPVSNDNAPYKSTFMTDEEGNPFEYPYFIHDSYDSTDAVNLFNWDMATNEDAYPINAVTQSFTSGMIKLRRSTDAFRKGTLEEIEEQVSLIDVPEINSEDVAIAYQAEDSLGDIYTVFINADSIERTFTVTTDYTEGDVLVDAAKAGGERIENPVGVKIESSSITLAPLSATIIRLSNESDEENELPDEVDEEVFIGKPTVNNVFAGDTSITGEGQSGTTAIALMNDEILGTAKINSPFEIELTSPLEEGQEIEVYLEDMEQNRSETVRVTVLPPLDEEDDTSGEDTENTEDTDTQEDALESELGESEESVSSEEPSSTEGSRSDSESGTAEDTEEVTTGERLPVTATSLWTIGLLGLLTLSMGYGVKRFTKDKE
jgi:secreted pullulanase